VFCILSDVVLFDNFSLFMHYKEKMFCQGTVSNRILLTKLPSSTGEPDVVPSWPTDIRLVDETSVYFGRLQIKYREKWRGICANFQKYVNYCNEYHLFRIRVVDGM